MQFEERRARDNRLINHCIFGQWCYLNISSFVELELTSSNCTQRPTQRSLAGLLVWVAHDVLDDPRFNGYSCFTPRLLRIVDVTRTIRDAFVYTGVILISMCC